MVKNTLVDLIKQTWPMLILTTIIIIIFKMTKHRDSRGKRPLHREIADILFILYIYLLLELVTATNGNSGINIIPFTEIFRYSLGSEQFFYNVIWNVLVFIPIGYFLSRNTNAKKMLFIAFISLILSLSIELVQLQIGRSFDIDDIILNVIGSLLGFLVYSMLGAIKKHLPSVLQKDFIYNILSLIIVGLMLLYLATLLGFRWV